ncbi:peptidoglycan-binding domain-containing protein [Actinoplanes subtropicus]|uniref:peptidoglycan-binding domain-containing protein n=1 Tax=Actinoplanes subtropicus TaxID=543632 RepID=UPI0004C451A1|nr:peptidoglycan-binding domain-containing protein [Actinoplanes subtropicus]
MRRVLLIVPAAVAVAAVVAAATGQLGRRDPSPASAALTASPATATVAKRTLIRSETVGGSLGYGDAVPMMVPAAPGGGMVTWLPAAGDVLERGDAVYRLDQQKIPLLYGSIPLYRTLAAGSKGDDVRQLERNLSALGYPGFTVDDRYTASTATAVRQWQKDLGRKRTGMIEPGDAVVSSGARRVAELATQPGTAATGTLLKWTGTSRVVDVDLNTDYADLVRLGAAATVELPDGGTATAKVTAIGAPTSNAKGDGATLPVQLTVTDQRKLGRYQVAKVKVELAAETHRDVLAVPVEALVARPGGGYAVVTGGRHLPVRTGIFADGYVEIAGAGVVAGLTVGVPR